MSSKKKHCVIYGKWTECMWSVDPQTYENHKKSEKKGDNKKHKNVRTSHKICDAFQSFNLKLLLVFMYSVVVFFNVKWYNPRSCKKKSFFHFDSAHLTACFLQMFFYGIGIVPIYLFSLSLDSCRCPQHSVWSCPGKPAGLYSSVLSYPALVCLVIFSEA